MCKYYYDYYCCCYCNKKMKSKKIKFYYKENEVKKINEKFCLM